MTIGETIKQLRLSKGLNQKELAYLVGFDASTIGKYERDERRIYYENLCDLLDVLGYELVIERKKYE